MKNQDKPIRLSRLSVLRDSRGEIEKAKKFKPDISEEVKVDSKPNLRKKDPIVSKEEFDKSGFTNLRDFMNAKKYDEATGKWVNRKKALTRRDGKPANAIPPEHYSQDYRKGGKVKSSASKRADGCAQRGKTKGRIY